MSQTGITNVNPYGFNNNPAHLALLHKKGADLQYRSYFLVDQLHYGSISAYYKTSQKDGFGASIQYDGSTDLNDLLIGFFELFFVTISSLLYPIRLLGKITALDAISRD